jgi:penicillin-binding protein 1A
MRLPAGRLVRSFGIVALFLAAAALGTASGVVFALVGDLPGISALDDYTPGTITRVLGRDGSVVGEFATERRQIVTYDQIPVVLQQAIVSAEDGNFWHHPGVNLKSIAVTAARRALFLRQSGGASTITQQLARGLFLTNEVSWERKIKEALLAIQIEKRYTKQEILAMYCNKVYWGHHTYGVEAASQLYFAKSVRDLTLDEAAMIAGIIQGNARQSPYVNMKAALARRNYTLDRMVEEGYLNKADADAARKRPIVVHGQPWQPPSIAPYFMETIRVRLEEKYGAKTLDEGGLTIKTGLDPALQRAANVALDTQLRALDKVRGYRRTTYNIAADGKPVETYRLPQWTHAPVEGEFVAAVVLGIQGRVIQVRIDKWHGTIDPAGYEWTKRKPEDAVKRGDVIEARIGKIDAKTNTFSAALDQVPQLQGAVFALDNHTGQVLAMIGGQNFGRSQFNRAMQAQRQVGSLFKPFVYTAAIDKGWRASDLIDDAPASYDVGPGQPFYEPKNYENTYEGPVTLRHALEHSRNVPTVALMNKLGPENVVPYARRLGLSSPIPAYLSTAIGAAEGSLIEMTAAYAAYPNQGVRMTPTMFLEVTDREGNVLEESHAEPHEALRADTAYVVTNMLRGVVQRGTAQARAGSIDWPLAGKTGTTDDYTDAWFIGFDPDITIGVWVGFDLKKTIGPGMEGARAALPIWVEVMKSWVERRRAGGKEKPDFERPGNIVMVLLPDGVLEAFIAGTEPGRH